MQVVNIDEELNKRFGPGIKKSMERKNGIEGAILYCPFCKTPHPPMPNDCLLLTSNHKPPKRKIQFCFDEFTFKKELEDENN